MFFGIFLNVEETEIQGSVVDLYIDLHYDVWKNLSISDFILFN